MPYDPKPIDTSLIRLTPELKELTERLAENTHDVWARQRMEEGWRYGPARSDPRKENPSLVGYGELSESEKEYDRKTAIETVKLLMAMGYSITSAAGKSALSEAMAPTIEEEVARCRRALVEESSVSSIAAILRGRDLEVWSESPTLYELVGNAALGTGEPLIAFDLVQEGLKYYPGQPRLRQLQALSLSRSGATREANAILNGLLSDGHRDEETLGILASTFKDLASELTSAADRDGYLREAYRLYVEAYDRTRGYYPGINAAALAVVLGDHEDGRRIASEVRRNLQGQQFGHDYWAMATLAEAALILGEWQDALDCYRRSIEIAGREFGNVHSTRRNARLLLEHLQPRPPQFQSNAIESCLRIPNVVVFAGHMIDQPGRAAPRFPQEMEPVLRAQLRERLSALNAGFGYTSAACGSDILFAEVMLELGNEVQIVLPYEKERFIEDSVDIMPDTRWKERCENVIQRAAGVTVASDRLLKPGGVQYEYANLYLFGMALARARQLDTALRPLAIWDGAPGDGEGGTASAVERWHGHGLPVELISTGEGDTKTGRTQRRPVEHPEICGLLFGDAVGFSKLSEEELPRFVSDFLGLVGELANTHPPLIRNTWGDGLYLVFPNVREAGIFALELCSRVSATNWNDKGLRDLNLRVGLHAGPVFPCIDPVTNRLNYIGTHVSRAARIEPITPPGHVYASQAFAAIAAVDQVKEFTCDYVGRIGLAKGYGAYRTYIVRRAPNIDHV